MGIGCVLVILGLGACIAAALLGTLFAATSGAGRRNPIAALGWFALPFAYVAYFGVAFLAYAFASEARGYDAMIGDSWSVPLGHGYEFGCIDTWEGCSVGKRDAEQQGVRRVARDGAFVLGEKESGGFFALRTTDGRRWDFADETAMRRTLQALGVRDALLQSTEEFYARNRWTLFDAIAASLILGGAVVLTIGIALFLRARR